MYIPTRFPIVDNYDSSKIPWKKNLIRVGCRSDNRLDPGCNSHQSLNANLLINNQESLSEHTLCFSDTSFVQERETVSNSLL